MEISLSGYADAVTSEITVTGSDLEQDGSYLLRGVTPGNATVMDQNGRVVAADQREMTENGSCVGTVISFSEWLVDGSLPGTWRIRLARGRTGPSGQPVDLDAVSPELALIAMVFGQ